MHAIGKQCNKFSLTKKCNIFKNLNIIKLNFDLTVKMINITIMFRYVLGCL